jgi:WD40 repeat protein
MALSQPRLYASDLSPDGKWRAEVLVYDCVPVGEGGENAYEQLRLVQVASNRTEIADSQLRSCGGLGAFGLAGLFWSPNSGYFYYTDAREGGPDGCPGYWEPPFLRVNVSNLESEYLGSGARSPDGTKLATWQELELVVWDVDDGEITRLPALDPAATTGPVAWSPDSQVLVYLQFDSVCTFSGPSRLVRVDIPGSKQTLLLQSESPTFIKAAWDEPDLLTLSEENGNIWSYRFSTNELQPSP